MTELDDLELKALLAAQNAELQQIRLLLEEIKNESEYESMAEDVYECVVCRDEVVKSRRREHLTEVHNAPDIIPLESKFDKIT